ncbi:MAG: DUF11 domain-containing protein [Bacteroidetes bacterium]|nr:DUF11 domain-containing protein [Bacteroidota bacterium]
MRYSGLFLAAMGLILFSFLSPANAQTLSSNTVKYKLTYNKGTEVYTVWVHPDYNTPNANNSNTNEFSATAQVSLKVPRQFVIQNITDINGFWEKIPRKLGDPVVEPALASETYDSTARYYAIGKAPIESNLGKFSIGDSVALFSFQGNNCFGPVSILAPQDPFVQAAFNASSLNVRGSFYSRSGQPGGGNVTPLEQFIAKKGPDAFCDDNAQIGAAKRVVSVVNNNNGSYDITFEIKAVNTGSVALTNVQLYDTLSKTFPSPATFSLVGGITTVPAVPVNGSFTGAGSNTNLLSGSSSLAPGAAILASFTVRVVTASSSFQNVAWGEGTFNGTKVRDKSTDGNNADPDGNGNPGDNGLPTPIVINQNTDVALFVSVSNKLPQVNDVVTIKVVVKNEGQVTATGVAVKDALPVGLDLTNATGDGSYTAGNWTIGNIAVGDSAELFLTVKVVSMGVQYYTAEVSAMNEPDVDSSPNNGVETEDDFGRTCVSAPITLCSSQAVELSVPAGSSSIQWSRNGTPIPNETGTSLTVTKGGTYTFSSTNSTCPTGGCCPIIVEEVDCCPVQICVPVVITRTKRSGGTQP